MRHVIHRMARQKYSSELGQWQVWIEAVGHRLRQQVTLTKVLGIRRHQGADDQTDADEGTRDQRGEGETSPPPRGPRTSRVTRVPCHRQSLSNCAIDVESDTGTEAAGSA